MNFQELVKNMPPYTKTSPKEWEDKFAREGAFMPFGSICNLIGQALAGKGIDKAQLIELTDVAYTQAQAFVKKGIDNSKVGNGDKMDLPF